MSLTPHVTPNATASPVIDCETVACSPRSSDRAQSATASAPAFPDHPQGSTEASANAVAPDGHAAVTTATDAMAWYRESLRKLVSGECSESGCSSHATKRFRCEQHQPEPWRRKRDYQRDSLHESITTQKGSGCS
jgi:hypothetical protein